MVAQAVMVIVIAGGHVVETGHPGIGIVIGIAKTDHDQGLETGKEVAEMVVPQEMIERTPESLQRSHINIGMFQHLVTNI
jgi:hypothetical protein